MSANFARRVAVVFCVGLGGLLWLALGAVPQSAQGVFATNTPAQASATRPPVTLGAPPSNALFATNTPAVARTSRPVLASPTPRPSGPVLTAFNYSLRQWLERDLVNLALEQISALGIGDVDLAQAIQVTLYELERRYPGAPTDVGQRRQMIDAMLAAPAGAIDMRAVVRPLIEMELNTMPDAGQFSVGAFDVSVSPANLDNDSVRDAVLHISANDDAGVLYDEFVLARGTGRGFDLFPTQYDLFAVPFGDLVSVALREIGDVNNDGLDEVVLVVDDGAVNQRLFILGARNGVAIDLTEPGEEIRFSEIVNWPTNSTGNEAPVLNVLTNRVESEAPDWQCVSQQPLNWMYERNFYRASAPNLNTRFEQVDSLGCTLATADLFALGPSEAIEIVELALVDYGFEAAGVERALMTLAMLYTLEGRLEDARGAVLAAGNANVLPAAETWLQEQTLAFESALGISSNTAFDICVALAAASEAPACDIDALLARELGVLDLDASGALLPQLADAGFNVVDSVTISEIGRAERTVIRFDIAGAGWWAFVPNRDGGFDIEAAQQPQRFDTSAPEAPRLRVPESALDALFVGDDPANTLNIINNLRADNPSRDFTPDGLFVLALSYELTGAREDARLTYYDAWARYPDTIWGQLAAQHLDVR